MLQIFNYNNSGITFRNDNGTLMVNATEMAKPFGKIVGEWKRLPSTTAFLEAIIETKGNSHSLIMTVEGRNGGTWMHEDVALEFARWLSPAFAIWCNDRIKELLTTGKSELPTLSDDALILQSITILQDRVEAQKKQLQLQAPKVQYFDSVMQSPTLIPTTLIAKDLGMSAVQLNKLLHRDGIIYKQSGTWVLYNKYQDLGYTGTKTQTYTDSHGIERTVTHMYWTEKGKHFIMSKYKQAA